MMEFVFKVVKNIVGKTENADNHQIFSFSNNVLKKNVFLTFYHIMQTFEDLRKKSFDIIVAEGENDSYQHFLRFPHCFLPSENKFNPFPHNDTF